MKKVSSSGTDSPSMDNRVSRGERYLSPRKKRNVDYLEYVRCLPFRSARNDEATSLRIRWRIARKRESVAFDVTGYERRKRTLGCDSENASKTRSTRPTSPLERREKERERERGERQYRDLLASRR